MRGNKWLSILLISVLALCLLCGCAGNEQQAETTSIKIGGSSTMAPIIAKCADNFTDEYKTWNKKNQVPIFPKTPDAAAAPR
jgi:phosphate transport system substrate-binding protein